jgi:hypothetical protein
LLASKITLLYSKILDDTTGLPFGIPFLDGRPFVPDIFSSGQPKLQLDAIVFVEIGLEWNNGHAGLIGLLQPFASFVLFDEQWPDPSFFVLKVSTRHGVFANVTVHQVGRPAVLVNFNKGILQIHLAVSDGLDFGALQRDSGLECFDDFVLEASAAVDANGAVFGLFLFCAGFGVQASIG